MTLLNNPIEIWQFLDQSNCRQCGEATCMAFAAAVVRGDRQLEECPYLDKDTLQRFGGQQKTQEQAPSSQEELEAALQQLKQEVSAMDLSKAVSRTGGWFDGKKLTLKVLGENFQVDTQGMVYSRIHTNAWVTIPVLTYILYAKGSSPRGNWMPFRDLKYGMSWSGLYEQRCIKPLQFIADEYRDLFVELLEIFQGERVANELQADISYVLHPLPKVPMLFCYWKAEEEFESKFNIYFDQTIEDNLNMQAIFALSTGLGSMFEALVKSHVPASQNRNK